MASHCRMWPAPARTARWTPRSRSLRRSRPSPAPTRTPDREATTGRTPPARAERTPASSLADSPPPGRDSALRPRSPCNPAMRSVRELSTTSRAAFGRRPAARGSLRSPCSPANTGTGPARRRSPDRAGQAPTAIYTRGMRFAMRALVYLALPSVAFAWLLQVDFPARRAIGLDHGFGGIYRSDTLAHLAEAGMNAVIGLVVV